MISSDIFYKIQPFIEYNHHSMDTISRLTGLPRRALLDDLQQINSTLEEHHLDAIDVVDEQVQSKYTKLNILMNKLPNLSKEIVFQDDRPYILTLFLMLKQEFVTAFHFQEFFKMSRNTVNKDILNARKWLKDFNVEIDYTRQDGYTITGRREDLARVLDHCLAKFLTNDFGFWTIQYIADYWKIEFPIEKIKKLLDYDSLLYVPERFNECIYFVAILCLHSCVTTDSPSEIIPDKLKAVHRLVDEMTIIFPKIEPFQFEIFKRLITCVEGQLSIEKDQTILEMMGHIKALARTYTGLDLSQYTDFDSTLYQHLVPAYYRMKYDIQIHNPFTQKMKVEYADLFELVGRCLKPLEEELDVKISDDELAYFTMHFGGYLSRSIEKKTDKQLKAVVVCPNGVSSSLIIAEELRRLIPELAIDCVLSQSTIENVLRENVDVVFSTTYFKTELPLIVVNPRMNALEKELLKQKIYKRFNLYPQNEEKIEAIMGKIAENAEVKNKEVLEAGIRKILIDDNRPRVEYSGSYGLEDLVQLGRIQIIEKVASWQDSVSLSAKPLLKSNSITEGYIENTIEAINTYGPYVVIAPQVAIPHGSPNQGVKELAVSVLKLNKPVIYDSGANDRKEMVSLIFFFAIKDHSSHLKALRQAMALSDDTEFVQQILNASTVEEIDNLLKEKLRRDSNAK